MKNLTFTKKIFLSLVAVNVLVFGVYAFLFWKVIDRSQTTAKLLVEETADKQKNDALQAIKMSLSDNKDFISQIDSFFIAPDGVVGFITFLETLGKDSGVAIAIGSVDVNPDSKDPNDFKESLNLKLEIEGTWQNVLYFLSRLENLPYQVQFDTAAVSLQGASDSLPFKEGGVLRKRMPEESWKGLFDVRFLKLK